MMIRDRNGDDQRAKLKSEPETCDRRDFPNEKNNWYTKSVTGVVALQRILVGCAKRRERIPAVVLTDERQSSQPKDAQPGGLR